MLLPAIPALYTMSFWKESREANRKKQEYLVSEHLDNLGPKEVSFIEEVFV